MKKHHTSQRQHTGFTLIELLIVIAILGVLAAAILISLNPLEQLARGRDAGRQTSINQLGHSVQAYYTSQNATYPTAGTTWMTTLQTAQEIKSLPTNPAPGCGNAAFAQNGFCYQSSATDAIVYAQAESRSMYIRGACTGAQVPWIVWSSAEGKTGVVCTGGATTYPAVGVTGLK